MDAAVENVLRHFNLEPTSEQVIPDMIMTFYKMALSQELPFLPPDPIPEMLSSQNSAVPHLNQLEFLMHCLDEAVKAEDYDTAAAIAYVADRAAYRFGLSRALLKTVDEILLKSPQTPVAPQVVIRKARIMKDDGDLHGAMKVLDAVLTKQIKWEYKTEDQYTNVNAVCVQVKGQILHNLGLWKEAIDPLVLSVDLFNMLGDNKGTSSSLGLLTRCLNKLSIEDFHEVKHKFPQHFQTDHPCYEAYVQGEGAVQCIAHLGLTFFLCKHQLVAEESLLMFAVQQPSVQEHQWFRKIVDKVRHSLAGHEKVDFLKSAEVFFEFVRAVFMISLTLWHSPVEQDRVLSRYCEQLSLELYRSLCDQTNNTVKHTGHSVRLMNTALSFLGLPPLQGSDAYEEQSSSEWSVESSGRSEEQTTNDGCSAAKSSSSEAKVVESEGTPSDVQQLCDGLESSGLETGDGFRNGVSEASSNGHQLSDALASSSTDDHDGGDGSAYPAHKTEVTSSGSQASSAPRDKIQASTFPVTSSEMKYLKQFPKKPLEKFVGVPISHEEMLSSSFESEVEQTDKSELEEEDEGGKASGVVNLSVTHISEVSKTLSKGTSPIKGELVANIKDFIKTDKHLESKRLEKGASQTTDISISVCHQIAESKQASGEDNCDISAVEFSSTKSSSSTDPVDSSSGKSSSLVPFDSTTESSFDTTDSSVMKSQSSGKSSSLTDFDATTKSSCDTTDSSGGLSPLVDLSGSTIDSDALDSLNLGHSVRSGDDDLSEYLKNWMPPSGDEEQEPKVYRGEIRTYDPVTGKWTKQSTIVHLGTELEIPTKKKGKFRDVFHIQFLHQDEPLGKYVCKRYRKQRAPNRYMQDVVCQMTAGYYVTKFNQRLQNYTTEIRVQFLPTAHLQVLGPDGSLVDWVNVEPFLSGNFDKLTNNLEYFSVVGRDLATALSHFSYCESGNTLMIVDLQGWLPSDKSGIVYLTDPQFNTQGIDRFSPYDQQEKGMKAFWSRVHPECNDICRFLKLKRPS